MNDPQIWTLIGVFSAAVLGGLSLVVTLITRTTGGQIAALGGQLTGEIRALDSRLTGQIESLDSRLTSRIESLDSRLTGQIESLDSRFGARFDTVDVKFDVLDKEVAGLAKRVWGSNDA